MEKPDTGLDDVRESYSRDLEQGTLPVVCRRVRTEALVLPSIAPSVDLCTVSNGYLPYHMPSVVIVASPVKPCSKCPFSKFFRLLLHGYVFSVRAILHQMGFFGCLVWHLLSASPTATHSHISWWRLPLITYSAPFG